MERRGGIYSHMDCFLMTMELVYTSMNLDFTNMFINAWRFDYNTNNKDLAVYSFDEYMNKINSRYLELRQRKIIKEKVNLKTLKEYIDRYKIVVMTIDCFDCPWHRGYNIASIWHACALTGHNESGILCTDPFIKDYKPFIVPESVFEYGDFFYYTEESNAKTLNIEKLLNNIISNKNEIYSGIDSIKTFESDVYNSQTASELFDVPQDIYMCTITNGLKAISDYRYQLAYLLEHLCRMEGNKDEKIKNIFAMLYNISDVWLKVQHTIVRLFYEPNRFEKSKAKFQSYINEIIEAETKALSTIEKYVK